MSPLILALSLALFAETSPPPAHAAPPDVAAQLRAKDQALLDAIAPGDKAVWEAALAPEAVYVDENGTTIERASFMEQLKPLPAGASGHLQIVDYNVRLVGDTALVIQRAEEFEDYHGQALRTDYLMSETWRREGSGWKLLMVHAWAVMKDPPAIALPAAMLDQYVGRYRAAADLIYVIRREGEGLVGGREGGQARPLKVEAKDLLFTPGQPRTRKLFQRDAEGRITGYFDRREGDDLKWTRID
jgi:hypothetical protein